MSAVWQDESKFRKMLDIEILAVEAFAKSKKVPAFAAERIRKKANFNLEKIKMEGKLPPYCQCGGVIKDDGVFFGEPIPSDVLQKSQREAWKCDLMLICGTSAVVYPFADCRGWLGKEKMEFWRRS
jgi:hypothetical protein